MMINKFHLIILISTIFIQSPYAQYQSYLLDHYGMQEGFNSNQALDIIKDKTGFIWIGTENGLVRYDGQRFKYFKHNSEDATSISSNYVRRICLDKAGNLWLRAGEYLNYFDTKTNTAQKITIDGKDVIAEDFYYNQSKDLIYIVLKSGVYYANNKDKIFKQLHLELSKAIYFNNMVMIEDKFCLIGTYGIYIFHNNGKLYKEIHRLDLDPKIPNSDGFMGAYYDKEHKILYVGNWTNGLFEIDILTGKQKQYLYQEKNSQNGVIRIQKSNLSICKDKLWLGTVHGVKLFDLKTKQITEVPQFENRGSVLEGGGFSFYDDANDGLWIGTFNGLYKLDPHKQEFYETGINLNPKNLVSALKIENYKGNNYLWILNWYQKLQLFDLDLKKELSIPKTLIPFNKNERGINDFQIDLKSRIWITSNQDQILMYDRAVDKVIKPTIKSFSKFIDIFMSPKGILYFTSLNGIYTYNEVSKEVVEIDLINQHLAKNKLSQLVTTLVTDHNNILVITNREEKKDESVIIKYNLSSNQISEFNKSNNSEMKKLDKIEDACILDNKLYLSTNSGFCSVQFLENDISINLYKKFGEKDLLLCGSITSNQKDQIYISTDIGFYVFNTLLKTTADYNSYNTSLEVNPRPKLLYDEGKLYIAQKSNIVTFENKSNNFKKDSVILTELKISNYDSRFPDINQLKLEADQNNLSFGFANLNFTNSSDQLFQYRINNSNWVSLKSADLNFNNMGFGDYALEVRSINSQGQYSAKNYLTHFSILPPFYRTWWFQILVLCLIASIIYYYFWLREHNRRKMEQLRLRIARDLHDDLGSNLSNIKIISELEAKKTHDDITFTSIAQKSKFMMESMSEIVWSINPKYDNVEDLIQRIQSFAIDTLEKKDITLTFDIPDHLDKINIPIDYRRHIYLICKEAINNIAKYSEATEVKLLIHLIKHKLMISIIDNGIGFDPAITSKGNGLLNMKTRIDEMKGKLIIESNDSATMIKLEIEV